MGEELLRAGFRVISQYEVAGKRIDLVVEDRERRLAVECDGDAWHGPDQYEADTARQRMLERCGWKFIRIRGSVFYANQPRAFRDLIDAIRAHGLEPHAVTDDEATPRDWLEEISGNECMEALGAYTVDTAEENIVQQRELFPEESEEITPDGATVAMPAKQPFADAERPTPVSKPTATIVSVQEKMAVCKALDEAGEPLIPWKLAKSSKIDQGRLEEILPVLVREGFVKRVEAAEAVRYSRA
ncbi:MAG: DUF559 domain-containing protein [Planctomycetota bacterium]